jgi:protein involved in polysaccharide export with SLBB domain
MNTRIPKHPVLLAGILFLGGIFGGCETQPSPAFASGQRFEAEQTLHPGDTLRIAFTAAPTLDTTQQIRRDGKLSLPMIGEIAAADRTPAEIQTELRKAYASQLVSSEVNVTVAAAPFAVFVTGAVARPGKISSDRALTALEAVMEAGGFDRTKANPHAATVIRMVKGESRRVVLDLQSLIDGSTSTPFYLEAYDIVYVPERFWFF